MKTTHDKKRDATIAAIARDVLFIETLETRKSDRLDFHDVAVWTVREALEKAYAAGHEAATKRTGRNAK
ncbi:MAG TPA: hypothetical protein PKC49_15495 [Phycisphaerae bacterium]|nr:hypothetical protein [Phycisphaerae bacterium]